MILLSLNLVSKKTVPQSDDEIKKSSGIRLILQEETINISEYQWQINLQQINKKIDTSSTFTGQRGVYKITWSEYQANGLPNLTVSLNEKVILEQSMKNYTDKIIAKYLPDKQMSNEGSLDDMSITLETPEIKILIVFESVEINIDNQQDKTYYWLNIKGIYFKEK